MKMIQDLQNTIQLKKAKIKSLSKQITAKEGEQMDAAQMSLELEDMKTRVTSLLQYLSL